MWKEILDGRHSMMNQAVYISFAVLSNCSSTMQSTDYRQLEVDTNFNMSVEVHTFWRFHYKSSPF